MSQELEARVHAAFSQAPLSPDQIDTLYEHFDSVRGIEQPVEVLKARILRTPAATPTCQLLAGHRGSGKSTELARLQHELEQANEAYVIRFTAEDELDLNDVDAPDLLLAVARVVRDHLREHEAIDLGLKPLDRLLERFWKTLTAELSLEGAKLKADAAEVSLAIRHSPDYRRAVRRQLDIASVQLAEAVNELLGDALQRLIANGRASRLVLIVDDLDKVVNRQLEAGCLHAEHLFVNRAPQLTSLKCHVIYTVPLDLAYSHRQQALMDSYDCDLPVIPMVRVAPRPPATEDDDKSRCGQQLMRQMVMHRLEQIGLEEDAVFAPGVLDRFVRFTAGQPSELMARLQSATLRAPLPLDEAAAHRVEVMSRRSYARMLRAEHTPLLREAMRTGRVTRNDATEAPWRELVSSRALLLYMNDVEWYRLNPALEGVELPQPAEQPTP